MQHHRREPEYRVYWSCLGVVCDMLIHKRSDAQKMCNWLTKRGRTAWIVAV